MSVTTKLKVFILNLESENIIVEYDLYDGVKELYGILKVKNFFRNYNLFFSIEENSIIENLSINIVERNYEEVFGDVKVSGVIMPILLLDFIDRIDAQLFRVFRVISKLNNFPYRKSNMDEAKKIFNSEIYDYLKFKPKELVENKISWHKQKLENVSRILSILKVICQYSKNMDHVLKMEFQFN